LPLPLLDALAYIGVKFPDTVNLQPQPGCHLPRKAGDKISVSDA